jgi:hypothetical protein
METTEHSKTLQKRPQSRKAKGSERVPLPRTSTHLNELLEWYGHPTVKSLKNLHRHYVRDAFFKDPFTELYTTEELQKYYQRTLEKLSDVRFTFENVLEQANQAFVTWVLTFRYMGREFSVQGSSHLKFDASGLCEYHRDYFDMSEEIYEQLPVLGFVFKGLKRVLS